MNDQETIRLRHLESLIDLVVRQLLGLLGICSAEHSPMLWPGKPLKQNNWDSSGVILKDVDLTGSTRLDLLSTWMQSSDHGN